MIVPSNKGSNKYQAEARQKSWKTEFFCLVPHQSQGLVPLHCGPFPRQTQIPSLFEQVNTHFARLARVVMALLFSSVAEEGF